jgi:hypothetical protein
MEAFWTPTTPLQGKSWSCGNSQLMAFEPAWQRCLPRDGIKSSFEPFPNVQDFDFEFRAAEGFFLVEGRDQEAAGFAAGEFGGGGESANLERKDLYLLARTRKLRIAISGERTRLECGLRRPASANLAQCSQFGSRALRCQFCTKTVVAAGRCNPHAGRICSPEKKSF